MRDLNGPVTTLQSLMFLSIAMATCLAFANYWRTTDVARLEAAISRHACRCTDNPKAALPATNSNDVSVHVGATAIPITKPLLTTAETARLEGVNEDTVRRRIAAGLYTAERRSNGTYLVRNPQVQ